MQDGIEDAKIVEETPEQTQSLVLFMDTLVIDTVTKKSLVERFEPFEKQLLEWMKQAETMKVTDVSQTREMQMARTARLALRDIRLAVTKGIDEEKEESLRKQQALNKLKNKFIKTIEPLEDYLEKQEKFAEIQEELRKSELKAKRVAECYEAEMPIEGLDLANLPEEVYQGILTNAKNLKQAKIEAEAKAEADRIAAIEAEKAEQEKIRIENEKLKAELEEAEAKRIADIENLRKETEEREEAIRKEAEEKAKQERIEREKELEKERMEREIKQAELEKEMEAKRKEELEERLRKDEEGRKAAEELKAENERLHAQIQQSVEAKMSEKIEKLVDKETGEIIQPEQVVVVFEGENDNAKIQSLKKLLFKIEYPEMETPKGKEIMANVEILINKVIGYITKNEE